MANGSSVVEPRDDPGTEPGSEGDTRTPVRWLGSRTKRGVDLVAGLLLSVVTLPIVLVLCLGSVIAFRTWPLFRQPRLGRHGRTFTFLKIRSLPATVPADIDKYELRDQPSSSWGRFIRRTHLDEFPQCWLLLTGRMSLVGPRPEMPALSATYDSEFVRDRLRVRPGITGPWQIGPDSAGLIGENPQYDLWYLDKASPGLDAWILWRTLLGLLGAESRRLSDYPRRFIDE